MEDQSLNNLDNLIKQISMNDSNNNNNQAPTKVREENLQLFFLQGVESENRQLKVMLKKKNAELEELKMKNRKLESENMLMKRQQLIKIAKELDNQASKPQAAAAEEELDSPNSPTSSSSSKSSSPKMPSFASQMKHMKPMSASLCSLSCTTTDLMQSKALFVGNITSTIDRDDLNDYFSKYGEIVYITIPTKSVSSGKGFRYAFIKFKKNDAVEKIMNTYNGHMIKGCGLLVNRAKDKY